MNETREYKTSVAQRQRMRNYYLANRKALLLRARELYAQNPEPTRTRTKAYYAAHRDKFKQYARVYNRRVREARKFVFEGLPKIEF